MLGACGPTSKKSKSRNLSRNLHTLLKKWGKCINVDTTFITLTLKAKWPKIKPEQVPYPLVSLSAWASYIPNNHPRYFLGGCDDLNTPDIYCATFTTFWRLYRECDPQHPIYFDFTEEERAFLIPYAIHGDEGRGKNFIPTLVIAYQMIIPGKGLEFTNTAGYLGEHLRWTKNTRNLG